VSEPTCSGLKGSAGDERQGYSGRVLALECRSVTRGALDCIKAFSETDVTEDLKKFDIPMILHGDDDQSRRSPTPPLLSSKIVKDATLKVYQGVPHGLMTTHQDQFNTDLLGFLRS
jgi:non-heme chloroperoxidase